jgi:hypothetical protein
MLACGVGSQVTPTPQPPRPQLILPTARAGVTSQPRSTATPSVQASAAPATPTRAAQSEPTRDPKRIIITEEEILQAIAGGAGQEQGVKVQGLNVRFAEGKMTLTADELTMGPLQLNRLAMVGRLFAANGTLQFEAESVSPGGLVSAMLPSIANQVLAQFAAQWYIEEVRIEDGRLELRIR